MKNKGKTAIMLITILLIGMFIGFLSSIILFKVLFHKARTIGFSKSFMILIDKVIEPTDSQKDDVDLILNKYMDKFVKLNSKYKKNALIIMKEMEDDLRPILTIKQMKHLRKKLFKFESHIIKPQPCP